MSKHVIIAFLLFTFLVISSCKEKDGFKLTEDKKNDAKIDADNENIEKWSREGEADLAMRLRFINAVEGTFEGVIKTPDSGDYGIRILFVNNSPDFSSSRIRTLPEITNELLRTSFDIQIKKWPLSNRRAAIGCILEGIRPDIVDGKISVVKTPCGSSYILYVGDLSDEGPELATTLATAIRNSQVDSVKKITGSIEPNSTADRYKFVMERIE